MPVPISAFEAGSWEQQFRYKSFLPRPINTDWWADDTVLQALLSDADRKVGALHAYGLLVPDVDFFIRMYAAKEATQSSRIEGTKTEITEAVMQEQDIAPERRDDWSEVQNYIKAMRYAVERLETLPLSGRLLRETHAILLQGVRGAQKLPGEYRRSQNWIGGASLADAVFIPPHHEQVPGLMQDLENFLHNGTISTPPLIRAGMAHYQFETIHPFLDGNGRLGRLLITLYLVHTGLLSKPSLYLSDFINRNKTAYYDNLTRVREKSDLAQWLRFFLVGVCETADDAVQTFQQIRQLTDRLGQDVLPRLGKRRALGERLLRHLYREPVVSSAQVGALLEVAPATANRLLDALVQQGVLEEMTGYRRNRMFAFREYLRLFDR